jgi:Uma2 family endonuclease
MATSAIMTGPEFDALPYEEGRRWELLGGELIPVSSPTPEHQLILQRILLAFMLHLNANPTHGLTFTDVEFALTEHHRVRPDVLLLIQESARGLDMTRVPVPGSPDLAVEIISPTERSSETQAKLQVYLRNGAKEVWHVYSRSKSVVIHSGGTSATFTFDERITTPLLPGFSLEVRALFLGVLGL